MASESDSPQPIAWVAFATDGSESAATCLSREVTEVIAELHGWAFAPLYRSPTLTDAEREALEIAVEYVGSAYAVEHHAATLRGLLERTRGSA
jgi:hypothetical protein